MKIKAKTLIQTHTSNELKFVHFGTFPITADDELTGWYLSSYPLVLSPKATLKALQKMYTGQDWTNIELVDMEIEVNIE